MKHLKTLSMWIGIVVGFIVLALLDGFLGDPAGFSLSLLYTKFVMILPWLSWPWLSPILGILNVGLLLFRALFFPLLAEGSSAVMGEELKITIIVSFALLVTAFVIPCWPLQYLAMCMLLKAVIPNVAQCWQILKARQASRLQKQPIKESTFSAYECGYQEQQSTGLSNESSSTQQSNIQQEAPLDYEQPQASYPKPSLPIILEQKHDKKPAP